MTYTLHYVPDNASLIVRLALLELEVPFSTKLVDRQNQNQNSAAYLHLNPNGLIPVMETPDGIIFEAAAILLWLADRHGALAPSVQDHERACALKWLFWLSNTLHPSLRMLFYPEKYVDTEIALTEIPAQNQKHRFFSMLVMIEVSLSREPLFAISTPPNILQLYLTVCLRWLALYPKRETEWFDLGRWPKLQELCQSLETRSSVMQAALAEGLGSTALSNPSYASPPEGSAT